MTDDSDYYAILGVAPQATGDEIRTAFAGALSQFPDDVEAQSDPAYQELLHAFSVLNDPERRATYDSLLTETAVSQLNVVIQASREEIQFSSAAQLVYLLVNIFPPKNDANGHRPLNLSLVIDRSTSMKGARLSHVKAALELLVNNLAPDDIISVISFSDRAEVVASSAPIDDKQTLLFKIRSINAAGGTEIYQGLAAGVQQLRQVSLTQHSNHLILLTDGHTYGDSEQCLNLAQQSAQQGIDFSAFGIGSEWNDQFLDKLVAPSGGQSQYIEAPTQIIEHLRQRIKGLGNIHARNLRLSLDISQSVSAQFGFKLSPFAQPLTLDGRQAKLGNIEGRRPLSFLLELNIVPQTVATQINIPLTFTVDLPQQREYTFKHQYQITCREYVDSPSPPAALIKAVRLVNMYRLNEKALNDAEVGQLEAATKRMRYLTTRLLEVGQTQLAQQAHAEGDRLATMGTLSLEGRKKLKYGTRALLGQTIASLDIDSDD